MPSNERQPDDPSRADNEAAEEPNERVEESQHDPDAPGLGIVRDDQLEDIPEPNEPS